MRVYSIRTHKITTKDRDLFAILDRYLASFDEQSILAIASKIIAICQGRVVRKENIDKQVLVEEEADYFLPPNEVEGFSVSLTIKDKLVTACAGVDESNGNGCYVLWPLSLQRTVNEVRAYLRKRFSCDRVGVVVTDSRLAPLRWGVTAMSLAHSGFLALHSYVGATDLFGRQETIAKVNVADALATSAALTMGEMYEQTPLAVISDVPFVTFQDRDPSPEELQQLSIDIEDDMYAPLLKSVKWHKGEGKTTRI